MRVSLLSDFFMDIKNWVYNWDSITFAIIVTIIALLLGTCSIAFIKGILPKVDKKPKFKFFPILFLALLVAMLVLIISIRS